MGNCTWCVNMRMDTEFQPALPHFLLIHFEVYSVTLETKGPHPVDRV